jgi:hypothetical protein
MLGFIIAQAAEVAHEEAHRSEAPFFIAGGLLATFAVLISVVGFTRPDFPSGAVAARGIMAVSAALVAGAMATAVYVAG